MIFKCYSVVNRNLTGRSQEKLWSFVFVLIFYNLMPDLPPQ